MKHEANILNGKINFVDENTFLIQKAKLEGKRVVVDLKEWRKTRSSNQNRYIFGVVLPIIAEHLGYQDNETGSLWETIKVECGHYTEVVRNGKTFKIGKPSHNLSTLEFEKLASMIRTWASCELNCYVPLPNEGDLI